MGPSTTSSPAASHADRDDQFDHRMPFHTEALQEINWDGLMLQEGTESDGELSTEQHVVPADAGDASDDYAAARDHFNNGSNGKWCGQTVGCGGAGPTDKAEGIHAPAAAPASASAAEAVESAESAAGGGEGGGVPSPSPSRPPYCEERAEKQNRGLVAD